MIKLNLSIETTPFSSPDFSIEHKLIKQYLYGASETNYSFIDKLNNGILGCLGDGVSFSFIEFDNNYYINTSIIVNSIILNESDKRNVDKVIEYIDQELNNVDGNITGINYLEKYAGILKDNPNGFILDIDEDDCSGLVQINEVKELLNNNNIEYKVLSANEEHFECGTSGMKSKIMLYIIDLVIAGVSYDILKGLLVDKLHFPIEIINKRKIDAIKFDEFQNILCSRIKSDVEDLILYNFEENEEFIEMVFKNNEKMLAVKTSKEYVIKEIKTE